MNRTDQRQDYRRVPNLNLIPSEYQVHILPSRQLLLRLFLAIMIIGGAFIVINLYLQRSALQAGLDAAQQKVGEANTRLAAANARIEEAKKLQATIDQLATQNQAIEQALVINKTDWGLLLTTIFNSSTAGVHLISITNSGTTQVMVTGTSVDYIALLKFRDSLLKSPIIGKVISLSSSQGEGSLSFSLSAITRTGGK